MTEVDKILEGIEAITKGLTMLADGPFDYTIKKLLAARETLLTLYAPFKVGDRVVLNRVPDCTRGWSGCAHFLVLGALATVESSDCNTIGDLLFDVVFDDESWRDDKGNIHPIDRKHTFCFREEDLRLAEQLPPPLTSKAP